MRQSTTFALSTERGNQLRRLALEKRISVAELVTRWIDRELVDSNLPDEHAVIDIAIARDGDKVTFSAELFGIHTLQLDPAQAKGLADTITRVIDQGGGMLDMDAHGIEVHKRGTGIVIKHESFERSMPFYEAREIAQELIEAADQYGK